MACNQKGFSLVEIMFVVGIIGIIMAIAIGGFNLATSKINTMRTETLLGSINFGIRQFAMDTSKYPQTLQDLKVRPAGLKGWKGNYVDDSLEFIDVFGNDIQYHPNAKGAKPPYELYSFGKKGPDGDERIQVED